MHDYGVFGVKTGRANPKAFCIASSELDQRI